VMWEVGSEDIRDTRESRLHVYWMVMRCY